MNRLVYLFLFIIFGQMIYGQTILFSENFDSCALGPQWSYELEGNQDVDWGVGFPSNPKAGGLSINGSCFLFIDDDNTGDKTPPFNIRFYSSYFSGTGFTDILFQAQVHFRRDKTESMKIMIDNGKEEIVLREFKGANAGGDAFDKYIEMKTDISFYASDSMRIIIEYDDDSQWGWWAGIDNILVTASGNGNIVLGETFNGCAKPENWQTEIVNGVDDWQFGIFYDNRSIDGTCFAFFNDDILGENAPLSKIRLYSPFFNGEQYGQYTLEYDFIFRIYEQNEYLQLYVDNGKEWIPVKTYNGDVGGPNVDQFVKESIDLSPFRSENIRLIWEYNDAGWAWWLGMDNIKIVGEGDINDKCAKAKIITTNEECVAFDNTNALFADEFNINIPNTTGKVYFSWTAPASSEYLVSTSSIFNDMVEVFRGDCLNAVAVGSENKDEFGFKGEELFFSADAGQSYIFRVTGQKNEFGLDRGNGCIKIVQKNKNSVFPQNELCANALLVAVGLPCVEANNTVALLDGPLPSVNHRSRADIWYSFTPETQGDFVFESQADFADVITMYEGTCANLVETSADFNGQKLNMKNVMPGNTYFIQITGYFSLLEGKVCAKVSQKQPTNIQNPTCTLATRLNLNAGCTTLPNTGAGFSGISTKCNPYIDNDIWFSFIAPSSGTVYLNVKSDFPNLLAVYEGTCTELNSVYCSSGQHHCKGFTTLEGLNSGELYYIQIGSSVINGKSLSGNICLEISDNEPQFTRLQLDVTQECQSRGAVTFLPNASGGNGNYTYYGLGIQSPVLGNQTYVIEVTDGNGCVATKTIEAESCNDYGCTLASVFEKQNVTCFGGQDGNINITSNGGLEPYQYVWSNGLQNENIDNLTAGNYTVTISDATGCEIIETFDIYQPSKIAANATTTQPTCYGESNGSIETFAIGGNGNFSYLWSNGQTGLGLADISAGQYHITISDVLGCFSVESYTISEPDKINTNGVVTHNLCFGNDTGTIETTTKGGTGDFEYLWSNGTVNQRISDLAAGEYILTVTDENLCISVDTFTITQPEVLALSSVNPVLVITDTEDALLNILTSGGTAPYSYVWYKNGEKLETDTSYITTREIGDYHVVVTDANGCFIISETWTITRTSSTENGYHSALRIYPNPTLKEIILSTGSPEKISDMKISDSLGKLMWNDSENVYADQSTFDVSFLPSGMYTLSWKQKEKEYSLPFIKIQ
ncbi:MAG: T9SS type A sorting domain-containing protein [Saprospiraceae bacterium]|nr:T9SS type A sorting domain-containing protein [Saprospiraceae bacterium]